MQKSEQIVRTLTYGYSYADDNADDDDRRPGAEVQAEYT